MKFLKKAVSAFLATIMCIPTGIVNIAAADENDTNMVTTVTLSDTENGLMQFSEECMDASTADQNGYHMVQVSEDGQMEQIENDGSMWAFNAGDAVEVELIPDSGYSVDTFIIKDSASGDVLAEKETTDDIFSFTMPNQNIVIESMFKQDETVVRPELTDPAAAALQERIDVLPEEEGFYKEYEQMEKEELAEFNNEVNNIGETYFNSFSDEQRAQIDASRLYSTLLLVNGYEENLSDMELSDSEAQELQDKINCLSDIEDIADTTVINDNGYAHYCYSDAIMKISNEDQDALFLDTLELSQELSGINPGYAYETLDLQPLSNLVMFFTSGYSVMPLDVPGGGITGTEETFGPVDKTGIFPKSGYYETQGFDASHNSNKFTLKVTTKDKDAGVADSVNTVAYCANPSKARERGKTSTKTSFKANQLLEITSNIYNDEALLIRLILWYGKGGPGYGQDGAPKVDYVSTHFAIGKAYADDTGDESKTHASKTQWKELYQFAKQKVKDIEKDRLDLPTTGKIKKTKIDFMNFRVFVVAPSDKQKYQHIFFFILQEDDQSIDPLRLNLYKVESDDTKGTKSAGATLKGAEFVCKFYLDDAYNNAKEAKGEKPEATWTFTTKNLDSYLSGTGSDSDTSFAFYAENYSEAENEGSKINAAGIDFTPRNWMDEREKWKNAFIDPGDLESYRKYWGQKGTYIIYEKSASDGFKVAGEMICGSNPTKMTTTNLKEGMAIYYEPDVGNDDYGKYWVNGTKLKENVKGLGEDEPMPEVVMAVKDEQKVPKMETNAYVAYAGGGIRGTKTQSVEADGSTIKVCDSITIDNNGVKNAEYTVKTYLFDKTANRYVDIAWNPSVFYADTEINNTSASATDGPSITCKIMPGGFSDTGICNIIVQGNIVADRSLADHTLVFINVLSYTLDGKTAKFDPSSKDDTAEYITLKKAPEPEIPSASTDIISDYIQRKAGTGESIIYGGKYKDNTCKEGGGEVLQKLTDSIKYSGLTANKQYTIKGWLVDATTGEPANDAAGNEIKSETTKTADASGKGTWPLVFEFDATGLGGKKYVSFVEIYDGNTKLDDLDMKDKGNKYETFFIPGIKTKLTDSDSGTNITTGGISTLIDEITYTNLLPNTRYKIVSSLVDAETGEIGKDANGNDMKSKTEVTSESESGTFKVQLEFEIDSSEPKVYVAFEEIFIEKGSPGSGEWVLVADHKDIMDQNQMTSVPGIKTFAKDQKTNGHLSYAEDCMVIYDTLHYENFIPGLKYRVDSELIDTATNTVVVDDDGVDQRLTMYFTADENFDAGRYLTYGDITPDNHDGNGIVFRLNGESLAGHTFVIYERVYVEDETGTHLVASHQDPLDENQTIHIPKIWTNAVDVESQSNISYADETARIKDTISYENLIPGLTYEIHGRVIDKKKTQESGTEVVVAGTDGKEARNSVVFTPDTANGTQELTFDIDMKKYVDDLNKSYAGAVFVVYEDLYVIQRYDGTDHRCIVASHTDINDENQTIYLPKITTSLDDARTGTKLSYAEKTSNAGQ